jgi:subtilisin family serine protease/subtilisin-like proprotein convertase family protein
MLRWSNRQGGVGPQRRPARPALGLEVLEDRTLLSSAGDLLSLARVPNDPRFPEQWGLSNDGRSGGTARDDIHAPQAWDVTTGSRKVVVSVMDTGIDYNHPDLYQNIWLNQAEIPLSRLRNLIDVDGDGLITFADLNDPRNQGPFKITDVNGDGRIDAADILAPMVLDASGHDTGLGGWAYPGNTQDGDTAHPNDFIGWNFVNNTNNPFDDNGHGTNVAGVIGAMSNDGVGVAGVDWQVSLMPVKFFDASGHGTIFQFIQGLNYAVAHGAVISNNSWAGAGNDPTLLAAIQSARLRGMIFVAAAGNFGMNLDTSPTYPAAFPLDNVVAVAATDRNDQLVSYSDYGAHTVALAAPGQAILTTAPGNGYDVDSGTSLAAPFVSGAMALVWAEHPGWTYTQVIHQVLSTVDPLPGLKGKTGTGGRLDLAAAVGWSAPTPANPPRVIESDFRGPAPGSLNDIRVTFNKQIEVGSFDYHAVQLIGPDGRTIPVTAVRVADAPANRTFDIFFATQTAPGVYSLTLGPNVKDPRGTHMVVYHTLYTLAAVSTFRSTAPATIPALGLAGSPIVVNQDVTIGKVTVLLNIDYPDDGGLYVHLQAPDGTDILLSNQRGGTGQNFTNTLFDDNGGQSIRTGLAPFTGTYQPEGSLSNLKGRNARGTWLLWVEDRGAGVPGTLVDWTLTITAAR